MPEDRIDISQTRRTEVRRGFYPAVIGNSIDVRQSGAVAFIAGNTLQLQQGGGQWLLSLWDLRIREGGGAILAAKTAHVEGGFVALLCAGRAELTGGARVLVRGTAALALAAAAGFLGGLLLGRARKA